MILKWKLGCLRREMRGKKMLVMLSRLCDLCHVGCARLAGQKWLIKKLSLVLEGRWYGILPGSPFPCARAFFPFPFPVHLLFMLHFHLSAATAHKSVFKVFKALYVKDLLRCPWMGLIHAWKLYFKPIQRWARQKAYDSMRTSKDIFGSPPFTPNKVHA